MTKGVLFPWTEEGSRIASTDEAMRLAGQYADLIARYFIVEILLSFRRGYNVEHYSTVFDQARKNAYGFSDMVGDIRVGDGKYMLSTIFAQSTNNDEFRDLLMIATLSVLTNLTAYFGQPNKKETDESKAFQEGVREAPERVNPPPQLSL